MRTMPIIAVASTCLKRSLLMALGLATLLLAGCGKSSTGATASGSLTQASAPAVTRTPVPARLPTTATAATGDPTARTGVLTNPDNATMVFLYYDLAGITPPIDQWVEQDNRVTFARGADKAAQRRAVKAELQAGMAAVHDVGVLHLTTNADLGDYDPTYGEFTVGALSPASVYRFKALQQHVTLKFDNGLVAQSWSVSRDQAQAVIDRIGNARLALDTVLKLTKVVPGPGGGTLVAHVVSWNLRDTSHGSTITRVQVPEGNP